MGAGSCREAGFKGSRKSWEIVQVVCQGEPVLEKTALMRRHLERLLQGVKTHED